MAGLNEDLQFNIFAIRDRIAQIDENVQSLQNSRLTFTNESKSQENSRLQDDLNREKQTLESRALTLERFAASQGETIGTPNTNEQNNTLRNILIFGGALVLLG